MGKRKKSSVRKPLGEGGQDWIRWASRPDQCSGGAVCKTEKTTSMYEDRKGLYNRKMSEENKHSRRFAIKEEGEED